MNVRIVLAVLAIQFVAGCASGPPTFKADPNWPQPLPEEGGVQLVMGQVAGIAVNPKDNHVWIIHRPSSLLPDEWNAKENKPVTHRCCKSAPPVMEFDASGKYLRGWGPQGPEVQWPKVEHGIYIDPDGNVWIAGNGNEDNQILKLTPAGAFRQQIGFPGKSQGSNSTQQLGRPAHMVVSGKELFVADGYGNRRLVVFDADTGVYKRHWGAYGGRPNDEQQPAYDPKAQPSRQFGNPVHCVRVSNDGKVYVCDRVNNRIQVFGREGDFQGEFRVEVETRANGSTWDMVLSHDEKQRYMYVADGANGRIYILERADGKVVGQFGRTGRMPGEFKWIHNIAIDKDGNLYTSEVGFGRRIQKFVRSGGSF